MLIKSKLLLEHIIHKKKNTKYCRQSEISDISNAFQRILIFDQTSEPAPSWTPPTGSEILYANVKITALVKQFEAFVHIYTVYKKEIPLTLTETHRCSTFILNKDQINSGGLIKCFRRLFMLWMNPLYRYWYMYWILLYYKHCFNDELWF